MTGLYGEPDDSLSDEARSKQVSEICNETLKVSLFRAPLNPSLSPVFRHGKQTLRRRSDAVVSCDSA